MLGKVFVLNLECSINWLVRIITIFILFFVFLECQEDIVLERNTDLSVSILSILATC